MSVPAAVLDQHSMILGKTRSGKSSVMRGWVEWMLERGYPTCIVDPKGDWWGLKSSADGKTAGFPIVIFGGKHGDVPINAKSGKHVAELVATGNRPCIIDLGGWRVGDRTEFFIEFAATFFLNSTGNRWLVIDEVHNFVPQGKIPNPQIGEMLHWGNRLASEGLGKGIHLIAASQRPQKCHKDFITSMETLVAMKVIHNLDRKAIKDWIDGCPDAEKGRDVMATLASLPRGSGWTWSPEIGFGPKLIDFPMFATYDSFKPSAGNSKPRLRGWASVDLDEVRSKLESAVQEAADNDPKILRKTIADLRSQLAKKVKAPAPVVVETVDTTHIKELEQGIDTLKQAIKERDAMIEHLKGSSARMVAISNTLGMASNALAKDAKEILSMKDPKPVPHLDKDHRAKAREISKELKRKIRQPDPSPTFGLARPQGPEGSTVLSKGQRSILTVLVQYEDGADETQIAILTGYKATTRYQTLKELRAYGYAERHGKIWKATRTGAAILGPVDPLPQRGQELIDYWKQRLDKGALKIFELLVDAPGEWISKNDLAENSGYKATTTYQTLKELRARKLVTLDRGKAKASEQLFD